MEFSGGKSWLNSKWNAAFYWLILLRKRSIDFYGGLLNCSILTQMEFLKYLKITHNNDTTL